MLADQRIVSGMRRQLAGRRTRLDAGEQPLGWKVGFGAPAAMASLSIHAPLVGYLMQSAALPSGGSAPLAGWTKPVAEPEIALHIASDLDGEADDALAAAAIAGLSAAIELADLDRPPDDVEAILAGNIYQRHVVLGPLDRSRAGGSVDGLTGQVFRNGAAYAVTDDPQAATGALIGIVRHVATLLPQFGERLRAGDIIITGSVVPPLFLDRRDNHVAFSLGPAGDVSIRLVWPSA